MHSKIWVKWNIHEFYCQDIIKSKERGIGYDLVTYLILTSKNQNTRIAQKESPDVKI